MPTLPWTTIASPPHPVGACTIFAAQLPLRRYRQMPRLMLLTLRIRRQLTHTPGLLGYGLDLQIRHKTLWTSSAWAHRADLAAFDQTAPHRTAKHALEGAIVASTFTVWTCRTDQLPVPWRETRARLGAASHRP